eukprot:gene19608-26291_t
MLKIFENIDIPAFAMVSCSAPLLSHDKTTFKMGHAIGKTLKNVHTLDKALLRESVKSTYLYDALTNVAGNGATTFVEFVAGSRYPRVECEGVYHPCLKEYVKNDIALGGDLPNNIIVTGPNAGGKSTFMKALFVNMVVAQSLGVSWCTSMRMTPFQIISTQMNVPDCKGKESLFQAEMNRCKAKLDLARTRRGFMAFAMDELFSSTEPIEGIAAAYAVAKKIGSYDNIVMTVSTHYTYLTNLAKVEDFENYTMTCTKDLEFPYKLEKGVSNMHVALDLMLRGGFDKELVRSAIRIRDTLSLLSKKENVPEL